jgi:hypothetical protein
MQTIEKARRAILIYNQAMERVDEAEKSLAETRWMFELLKVSPEAGVHPKGTVTSEDIRGDIQSQERMFRARKEVFTYLTGTSSVTEARQVYFSLLNTVNVYMDAVDVQRKLEAGYPVNTVEFMDGPIDSAFPIEFAKDAQQKALTTIEMLMDKHPIPEMSTLIKV